MLGKMVQQDRRMAGLESKGKARTAQVESGRRELRPVQRAVLLRSQETASPSWWRWNRFIVEVIQQFNDVVKLGKVKILSPNPAESRTSQSSMY